jgi:hypothetical protein
MPDLWLEVARGPEQALLRLIWLTERRLLSQVTFLDEKVDLSQLDGVRSA